MCDALSIIGAVVSAAGSMQKAQAEQDEARYRAKVAANNAKVAEWQAQSAEDKGTEEAMQVGRKQAELRGQQKSTLAANGLDLGSGSPAALVEQTDYYGLQDQRSAMQNGMDQAWGARAQRDNFTAESNMQRTKASNIDPGMAGATSLLGSAGNIADKWEMKNPGKSWTSAF